jgi:hypothetical protein
LQDKQSIFHKTVERMVNAKSIYHKKILTV